MKASLLTALIQLKNARPGGESNATLSVPPGDLTSMKKVNSIQKAMAQWTSVCVSAASMRKRKSVHGLKT